MEEMLMGASGIKEAGGGLATSIAIVTSSLINSATSLYLGHKNRKAQEKRDERLQELQERHRLEDKHFQLMRDDTSRSFQYGIEAQRMSFQEHLELRRLQFQVKMEQRKEEFQIALTKMQQDFNREIAQFQAQAMRETQILVARENAQNMLSNQVFLEALKTFPLNISPMVLLGQRPNTLSSLLRFTLEEKNTESNLNVKLLESDPNDVLQDVIDYTKHPEALNIFIAPVYVDSKMAFQKTLSTKIWESTYQKIESFFTKNYSRDSKLPVVFYPTAWNDKYTSGVHASETLHYFLKDLPCIVLEPKFDGSTFRLAISSWGLGYNSTEHHRSECQFDINIDLVIANAVYERSKNALAAIATITSTDIAESMKRKYYDMEQVLRKNINLYEAFGLGEIVNGSMPKELQTEKLSQIKALGVGNIFALEGSQDLDLLANYFSAQIGVTLAMLADVHHMVSTNATPILPRLIRSDNYFKGLSADKHVCEILFTNYKMVLAQMRDEECSLADGDEAKRIYINRTNEIKNIKKDLEFDDDPIPDASWDELIRKYTREHFNFEDDEFARVWNRFIYQADILHVNFMQSILPQITDEELRNELEYKIESL